MSDSQTDRAVRSSGDRASPAGPIRSRVALVSERGPGDIRGPSLRRLAAEAQVLLEPLRRLSRKIAVEQASTPRTVMLLPGFATHPVRMRYMAKQLERAGHTVKRWGLGFNLGVSVERFDTLERRITDLHHRYGQPIVLVGWSLGGIFARELAKRHPDKVDKVITMGSPFSGSPRANNAWRAYHLVAGHSVDHPPVEADVAEKPPVETVAMWSPRDGIVSPRSSCGKPAERDRAIAVRCTHIGFAYDERSIMTVLRELQGR